MFTSYNEDGYFKNPNVLEFSPSLVFRSSKLFPETVI